jgi:transcriptional regulator with XRE-family HTH domain
VGCNHTAFQGFIVSVAFNPVDVHVGRRIRLRRNVLGLSQEKLADALGVTFQQVQKYERGANRISASRLFQLGKILSVPIQFFYDDYAETYPEGEVAESGLAEEDSPAYAADPMQSEETLRLVHQFYKFDAGVRQGFLGLMEKLNSAPKRAREASAVTEENGAI